MLVVRHWQRMKKNRKIGDIEVRRVIESWRGLFLFGIIPLWLDNYVTGYEL